MKAQPFLKYAVLILIAAATLSCTKETWINNDGTEVSKITHTALDSIKFAVVEYGDTAAFKELTSLYEEKKNFNFYPYALVMAKWYGYEPADYYVYRSLMDRDTLDTHLRNIAAKYFQKAVENGDTTAIAEMRKTNAAKQKQSSH